MIRRRGLSAALFALLCCLAVSACGGVEETAGESGSVAWESLTFDQSLELSYATQFSAASSGEGYTRIDIQDGNSYLLVPQGMETPTGLPENMTVISQPAENIYLAATSAMDLFRALDAIDHVTLSALKAEDWYIEEAREAMEAGDMIYAGKYRAPDYERILSQGCQLAIESTMIYHTPEVKEELENVGIPVLVERSSYESHPLGRMEWLKLYGLLVGKEDEAETYFNEQLEQLDGVLDQTPTGKTVAFFYITPNGAANVRKPGDYVAKAIQLAGGTYAFRDLPVEDDSAQATVTIQMETFYAAAKDADILIYNSNIEGEPLTAMNQLLEKSSVLADCKAVKEGMVWSTGRNLFQEGLGLGDFMKDLHTILTLEDPSEAELTYLTHLT